MATVLGSSRRSSVVEELRPRLRTTPGRLRVGAAAIVIAALGFGLVGEIAAVTRRDAARTAATESEPLLVRSVQLHDALADADATASATFVVGGREPSERRRRYVSDVAAASSALAVLARRADTSPEISSAVAAIGRDLPVYAGLVETARANNRQGLPIGAAYLRKASSLMRERLLPAAAQVYAVEGRELNRRYESGASSTVVVLFGIAALLLAAVLAGVQTFLARLTHRRFNVPLLAATVVFVAAAVWGLLGFAAVQRALVRAQRDGSDPVEVFSAVRVLALRAQADEGLSLTARGSGDASFADFDTALRMLGVPPAPGGLLSDAKELPLRRDEHEDLQRLAGGFAAYRQIHERVVSLQSRGHYNAAAALSVGSTGRELVLADEIRRGLVRLIASSQRRFEAAAADASGAVAQLWLAIPLLTVAGTLLGLLGVRMRLNEYR